MELKDMLSAVQTNRIQFATMRPPGSQFATLDRRVVVTAPPELVELSRTGDVGVLDKLVEMLKEPDRAWAAEVLLAAMTREDEKLVDSFSDGPDKWWEVLGETAYPHWSKWLAENKHKLVWDPEKLSFEF
jgi:hypothetical protein